MRSTPRIVRQMTVSAAMTPPTMAPIFGEFEDEDAEMGGLGDGEFARGDCCVAVDANCEIEFVVADEGTGVELDVGVVDASTLFGAGRRVSVPAFVPQAMYS